MSNSILRTSLAAFKRAVKQQGGAIESTSPLAAGTFACCECPRKSALAGLHDGSKDHACPWPSTPFSPCFWPGNINGIANPRGSAWRSSSAAPGPARGCDCRAQSANPNLPALRTGGCCCPRRRALRPGESRPWISSKLERNGKRSSSKSTKRVRTARKARRNESSLKTPSPISNHKSRLGPPRSKRRKLKKMEAAEQLRIEQAKLDQLQNELHQIDQSVRNASGRPNRRKLMSTSYLILATRPAVGNF